MELDEYAKKDMTHRLAMRAVLTATLSLALTTTVVAETVRLEDGRTVVLNSDNTYEFVESSRSISLTLESTGRPVGYGANPNRDCGLTFGVSNDLDGDILNIDIDLQIYNSGGDRILLQGIADYDLRPMAFSNSIMRTGEVKLITIDVAESCEAISQISIGDVSERRCNYVGRLPNERCRDLIDVRSRVEAVEFTK